ncbi:MAG: fumarate hydratase, partial [Desulfobacteraceae bacterium]|nr:fumarate hydratase [Desulfobacteraceae bacterium]
MTEFKYTTMFPVDENSKGTTEYKKISEKFVSTTDFEGNEILKIDSEALTYLSEQAFKDVAHLYRKDHLQKLKSVIDDPESSDNDRYVALELLKNAAIAAEMVYPMCQDTGTAIVHAKKGQNVFTGTNDEEMLSKGAFNAYTKNFLRYSQNAPLTMYAEQNTKCNLPAQVEISAVQGDEYKFLFMAKGGGSANKTALFQMTKAVLNSEKSLIDFMTEKMLALGTAACPPYYIAFVIG